MNLAICLLESCQLLRFWWTTDGQVCLWRALKKTPKCSGEPLRSTVSFRRWGNTGRSSSGSNLVCQLERDSRGVRRHGRWPTPCLLPISRYLLSAVIMGLLFQQLCAAVILRTVRCCCNSVCWCCCNSMLCADADVTLCCMLLLLVLVSRCEWRCIVRWYVSEGDVHTTMIIFLDF